VLSLVIRFKTVNIPHYRPEDQFKEASNAMRLKELHAAKDYNGLLELALMLNHQAAFNHSRTVYFMEEAMKWNGEITEEHEKMASKFVEKPEATENTGEN
jgi:hypothetical protein